MNIHWCYKHMLCTKKKKRKKRFQFIFHLKKIHHFCKNTMHLTNKENHPKRFRITQSIEWTGRTVLLLIPIATSVHFTSTTPAPVSHFGGLQAEKASGNRKKGGTYFPVLSHTVGGWQSEKAISCKTTGVGQIAFTPGKFDGKATGYSNLTERNTTVHTYDVIAKCSKFKLPSA